MHADRDVRFRWRVFRADTFVYTPLQVSSPGQAALEHLIKRFPRVVHASAIYAFICCCAVSGAPLFGLSGAATFNTVGDELFGPRNIEAAIKSNRFQLVAGARAEPVPYGAGPKFRALGRPPCGPMSHQTRSARPR